MKIDVYNLVKQKGKDAYIAHYAFKDEETGKTLFKSSVGGKDIGSISEKIKKRFEKFKIEEDKSPLSQLNALLREG